MASVRTLSSSSERCITYRPNIMTNRSVQTPTQVDRLSGLLEQFHISTHLMDAGPLRASRRYAGDADGHLHVVRGGVLRVTHSADSPLPRELLVEVPSVLFYPRPVPHEFHPGTPRPDTTCARLQLAGGSRNPLLHALPPLIQVPLEGIAGLAPSIDLLLSETERVRCGQRLLADHLFSVVLIQLLRWTLDNPEAVGVPHGLIAGLADPRLARALVAIHDAPAERWTLPRMARIAGMSRTAFATRFRGAVGQAPGAYLTHLRMGIAQHRLRQGIPLTYLAGELGYASASALSRAFSAYTGHSPQAWRALHRSGAPS